MGCVALLPTHPRPTGRGGLGNGNHSTKNVAKPSISCCPTRVGNRPRLGSRIGQRNPPVPWYGPRQSNHRITVRLVEVPAYGVALTDATVPAVAAVVGERAELLDRSRRNHGRLFRVAAVVGERAELLVGVSTRLARPAGAASARAPAYSRWPLVQPVRRSLRGRAVARHLRQINASGRPSRATRCTHAGTPAVRRRPPRCRTDGRRWSRSARRRRSYPSFHRAVSRTGPPRCR